MDETRLLKAASIRAVPGVPARSRSRPFSTRSTVPFVHSWVRKPWLKAAKYQTDGEKNGGGNAHDAKAVWEHRPGTSWLKPGYAGPFTLTDEHPVAHVSHTDSLAFCKWLTEQGGFVQDRWQYGC